MTATRELVTDRREEYAFHDDIVYLRETKRGLTRDTVEEISRFKEEPDWMRQYRLRAYDHFVQRPMPVWTDGLDRIDFDKIVYYRKPSEREEKSWDDVPDKIKQTFERLGIAAALLVWFVSCNRFAGVALLWFDAAGIAAYATYGAAKALGFGVANFRGRWDDWAQASEHALRHARLIEVDARAKEARDADAIVQQYLTRIASYELAARIRAKSTTCVRANGPGRRRTFSTVAASSAGSSSSRRCA